MLQIGFIGSDQMAQAYLQAFRRIADVQPVVCFDAAPEAALEFAKTNQLTAEREYNSVIDRSDLIYVGNIQSDLKKAILMAALESGEKLIICEPPFPFAAGEAESLIAKADAKKSRLVIGFTSRFKNPLRQFRYQWTSGRIGEAVTYWSHICEDWNLESLERYLQEEIDLIRWFGGEITRVFAQGNQIPTAARPKGALSIILGLENGMNTSLMLNWDTRLKVVRRGLIGRAGTAILEQKGWSLPERMRFQFIGLQSEQVVQFTEADRLDSGILEMEQVLLGKLIKDDTTVATLADGLRAATIAQQIFQQAFGLADN